MSKTIALLGVTGRVGRAIADACLARGHRVRALARRADRVPPYEGLHVREGSVLSAADVEDVVSGADAVATALGTPPWSTRTITADAVAVLLPAMQRAGVRRLVAISALGIGDSVGQVPAIARIPLALPFPYVKDKERFEAAIRASDTDWTIVRPWSMGEGPAGEVEAAEVLARGARMLTFASTGAFVADEIDRGAFVRRCVSLSGR